MHQQLVELVQQTYYSHVQQEHMKDTLQLFKIIFKTMDEQQLRHILKIKDEEDEVKNKDTDEEESAQADPVKEEDPVKEAEEVSTPNDDLLAVLRSRQLTGDQRSTEWLMQRHNYITASISAACAGLMGAGSREAQLIEKASYGAYRSFKGGYHTDMGNIFEDITANHYSYLNKTRVHDFRLIPHDDPEFGFLGASTDGVSDELNNIEIKTLVGRPLDAKIKKEYYHQMQHQMACLGLAQTHFLEAKYDTLSSLTEAARGSKDRQGYGVVLEFFHPEEGFNYVYAPDDARLDVWEKENVHLTEPGVYIRTIYWKCTGYQMKVVKRDPDWLKVMGPALKKFWAELEELRADPARVTDMIALRENKKQPSGLKCLI